MPAVIDYPTVLRRMREQGFRSLYHNSGAFGFAGEPPPAIVGWSIQEDPSIRPEMRPLVRRIDPPTAAALAERASRFWQEHLDTAAWVMPVSHWAFELDHGSAAWMPAALESIGIDPALLAGRNDGAAIDFSRRQAALLGRFLHALLENLVASDFLVAFPGQPVLCTIHHHRQLWWQTTDPAHARALREQGMVIAD